MRPDGTKIRSNPIPYTNAKKSVRVPVASLAELRNSGYEPKNGYPLDCYLHDAFLLAARKNSDLCPHPVYDVYVLGSQIWVVSKLRAADGQACKLVHYRHDLTDFVRSYDLTKNAGQIGESGGVLIARPPTRGGHTETRDRVHGASGEKRIPDLTGALKRAKDAGIYGII